MEPRESLRSWIARESPLSVARAASVGRRVAEAVAARHADGYSAAAAIDPDALAVSIGLSGEPVVELSPPAPGDARVSSDPAEDMPRLGAVLYELLAGVPPPARRAPPPVQRARPDLPESFGGLVMQCFHPGPAGRPRSAEEVARRLAVFETSAEAPAGVEWPPSPPPFDQTRATPVIAPSDPDPDVEASTTRPLPARPDLRASLTPELPRRPVQVFPSVGRAAEPRPNAPLEPPAAAPAVPASPPAPAPPAPTPKPLEDRTLARDSGDPVRPAALASADLRPPDADEVPGDERRGMHPLVMWGFAGLLLAATTAAFWIVIQTTGPSRAPAPSAADTRRATAVPSETAARPTALPVVEVSPPLVATPQPAAAAAVSPLAATLVSPPPAERPTAAPLPTPPRRASEEDSLREALDEWIASTNRRDISGHMRFYMPRVATFYLAHDVSRDFVWEEKSRLFAAGRVEVSASPPEIQLTPDGRSATMRFRKRYVVPAGDGERRGEVLQEMRWVRTPRGWRIVAERDAGER